MTTALPPGHRIPRAAGLVRGDRVLDVGANGAQLAGFVSAALYVALDFLEPLTEARSKHRVAAALPRLPIRDSSFSSVTCISVLQYVIDVETAVSELCRVVEPGGQVVILVPNMAYVRNVMTLVTGRFPWSSRLDDWTGGTVRYFTSADLAPLFSDVGLAIRRVMCTGRLQHLRSRFPTRLGADLLFDLERVR